LCFFVLSAGYGDSREASSLQVPNLALPLLFRIQIPIALATMLAASSKFVRTPQVIRPLASAASASNISAAQSEPPYKTALIYNQSKHASNSVLADLRAVWGDRIRVLQVVEDGNHRLPGTDGAIFIKPKAWGDMVHFEQRLAWACSQDHKLHNDRQSKEIVFMPGWSAFAESSETAVAVNDLGLVWPGTEPVASAALEKIGFKEICKKIGAPTPPFCVLSQEGATKDLSDDAVREGVVNEYMAAIAAMNSSQPGLIKSIHGM
jgi:hypothetical protein